MNWNHRVVRFKDENVDGGYRYEFKEVFYDDEGKATGYSNAFLWSEDAFGMQELAERLLMATTKKPLDESDFPNHTPVTNRDMEAMTHFAALKRLDYAVVAFSPEELKGVNYNRFEDRLIELGHEVINDMEWSERNCSEEV